ncbi:MAG TPA: hypothetical protein PLL66_00300 [Bacteroidales bacterium]|nr:hypothetical protein [Bacteroidales bacterium]
MKKLLLTIILIFTIFLLNAQFPTYVKELKIEPNGNIKVSGNLAQGKVINDLTWASNSAVACFPSTQNLKFNGKHVLYWTSIPPRAELFIKVIPDNPSANFSIYAYQISTNDYSVVPNLNSCVSCEAEHKWDYPKVGKTQDHTREISLNSVDNSYKIVIGVVGADGLSEGSYKLELRLVGGEEQVVIPQETVKVYEVESKANSTVSYKGNLNTGVKIHDLSWASSSSNACWPSTQDLKFNGNHVLYKTVIPPRSEMYVKVIPTDKNANFSIYAYQVGVTNNSIVPNLASCITCEAEHKWDYPKVGKTQDHTREVYLNAITEPYNVFIGVVGADGLTTGEYTLEIKIVGGEKEEILDQAEVNVNNIECKANNTVSYKGNLNNGVKIHDLSWASTSSNACWPSTQNLKFNGNHVLYKTVIPPRAEMYVKVIPTDKNANFSIYAYQVGLNNNSVVPNLASCVTCEAEHKWDYPKVGKTQDHTREIYLNSIDNSYNIYIGVVGADGLTTGEYTLEIMVVGGEESNEVQEEVKVRTFESAKNKVTEVKGNLLEGVKIHDLSWASTSSNACWPGTQNEKFTGNHVLYSTELPANSEMTITVIPDDKKANFSIYAYQVGVDNNAIVPNLPSCVTCEAEHKWDYPKVGKTQDHTRTISGFTALNSPYKVVIGVVGSNGLTEGSYTLKVEVKSR